ncbi:MAG: 50S ribosomal protein L13, partial [Flavobacteriales bacterium]|nr:50S ribosomal protein L13 [Flavobacteriales bacterium]
IQLSGNKWDDKQYVRHTGYPGGQRFRTASEMIKRKPIAVVEMAIKGMLPKNKLGRQMYRNLHVYAGAEHKHDGQTPKVYELKG